MGGVRDYGRLLLFCMLLVICMYSFQHVFDGM